MLQLLEHLRERTIREACNAGMCLPADTYRFNVFFFAALALVAMGATSFGLILFSRLRRRSLSPRLLLLVRVGLAPWVLGSFVYLYACFIEPRWLEVTHTTVATRRLPAGKRIRIALLTDVHSERRSHVMSKLPEIVRAEHPDLVVFAGDAVNSKQGIQPFEDLFTSLDAPAGRFAVYGNHDQSESLPEELFAKAGLAVLDHTPVRVMNGAVTLCGAPYDRPGDAIACLDEAGPGFRIVVYHSPDIIEDAATRDADLVLAGHTHGGQVRLPFFGAMITMSGFDKRYEAGLYRFHDTAMYVSRGVGQANGLPAIRFLCRPELAIIDVVGEGAAESAPPLPVARNPETNLPYGLE